MKKLALILSLTLATLCLAACGGGEASGGGSAGAASGFVAEEFIAAYNTAAAQTGSTVVTDDDIEPFTTNSAEGTTVHEDSLTIKERTLSTGSVFVQPDQIMMVGRVTDLDETLAEFTALTMAATGATMDEATQTINDILFGDATVTEHAVAGSTAEGNAKLNGYTVSISVTDTGIARFTIEP